MEQLRQFNAPQTIVDAFEGNHVERDDDEPVPIEVWTDLWDSVRVFRVTQSEMLAGFGGVVWLNVRPTEIESSCNMLKIRWRDRDQVLEDVQAMATVAAKMNNDEQSEKAQLRARQKGRSS